MELGPLQKQRRDALRFELACWAFAIIVPVTAAILLGREKLDGLIARPEILLAVSMPFLLVGAGAIGFHRLRKRLEREIEG